MYIYKYNDPSHQIAFVDFLRLGIRPFAQFLDVFSFSQMTLIKYENFIPPLNQLDLTEGDNAKIECLIYDLSFFE
jgi:hypothetical protein